MVGVQYYNGRVGKNERVQLVRDPHNKYDKNAIKVCNTYGQQIGHIKREVASTLAQLMDKNQEKVVIIRFKLYIDSYYFRLSLMLSSIESLKFIQCQYRLMYYVPIRLIWKDSEEPYAEFLKEQCQLLLHRQQQRELKVHLHPLRHHHL